MPRWPARRQTLLSSPSAPAECISDLTSSPMAPEVEEEAETLTLRSPSALPNMEDLPADRETDAEPRAAAAEVEETMPPDDDSPSSSASSTASHSRSPTPARVSASVAARPAKKKAAMPVQLIGELPVAQIEALATFEEISENNYQNKSLGRSREALEGMTCECIYRPGTDLPQTACGHGSNCINRLTQIECLPNDCRCRSHCQNQRFQRKEYADIEIVLTAKKGYGLRAEDDIHKDAFIYEYVGDVVNPTSFKKRMRDYAEEGIRHFYFMMLQKDEFIDATKSGGIGRFANHSCKPNCYVAKWTVGEHVRMGIFAKRDIQKYEELTFNYNVDRYGHKPQECYCGEPSCVGFIGGKTQTDIATVDDFYLDALGITDADEVMALKGTKKKRGKKLDDADFLPELRLITISELPKIIQALRQTSNREIILKLLTRFRLTEDETTCREMLRLRCLSLMHQILSDNSKDTEIAVLILESMRAWPLTTRNKIEDSSIGTLVKSIADSEDEDERLVPLAKALCDKWEPLPLAYRIPKRIPTDDKKEEDQQPMPTASAYDSSNNTPQSEWPSFRGSKRLRISPDDGDRDSPSYFTPEPPHYRSLLPWNPARKRSVSPPGKAPSAPAFEAGGAMYGWYASKDNWAPYVRPPRSASPPPIVGRRAHRVGRPSQAEVDAVIAAAIEKKAAADAAAAEAAAAAAAAAAKAGQPAHKRKHRSLKKTQTAEQREANKEKRLLKLVGAVVVKCMSKYGKSLEREAFKKYAKELTQLIAEKEKKSSSYRDNKLDALSDEKVAKIKKFSKEYIAKVVRKMEKSGDKRPPSTSTAHATSSAVDTPNSIEGVDVEMTEMTVEEAMDMDPASESEGEDDADMEAADVWEPEGTGEQSADANPPSADEDLPVDTPVHTLLPTDPRRRPPNNREDDPAWTWDPHNLKQMDKLNGVSVVA
ncbi:histone methyltransferase [Mycena pura]|uniref:Histone-lysine N-methyltransferase, H3 lysine-36 specific n=1 Tax=Mycena pura TaxID=153505 RepID=A0AAD6YL01_9AGAR|nr:histone methyltransferase [Mycena pura]